MKTTILESSGSVEIVVEQRLAAAARQAAFLLTDRAYAFLDETSDRLPMVLLRSRLPAGRPELEALASDFENEVHTQRIRLALERVGRAQRRALLRRAVAGE